MPRHFAIRISLLIISVLKTKKRRKFAEILQISAVLFILPIYFFIFVCYYIKVIFKACKTLRKEIKMKKLNLKAIAVAMAAALTLGLAGCSSNGNSSTADSSATAGDGTSVTESKAEGDNSLQKYLSAICRLVQEYLLCIRTSKMKKFMPSSPDAAPWWLTEKP